MGQVREEKEVAVAVLNFYFGSREIVVVEVEVGKEETLDVALALDAVTH